MIKKYVLFAGLFSAVSFLNAQTFHKDLMVSLGFVKNEYNGDYGNGILNFSKPWSDAVGVSLYKYITPSFDLGIQGSYGKYGYKESDIAWFRGLKYDASLFLHYKFANGYFMDVDSKFSPFLSIGAGLALYSINPALDNSKSDPSLYPTIIAAGTDYIFPVGAGLTYHYNRSFSLQYQYLYNITNSDVHDQNISGSVINRYFNTPSHPYSKPGNDVYGQHILSLIYVISEAITSTKCRCDNK
ncbi:MAG: hypothetical protein PHT07_20155 [Paludibacter sp.]|nr:hypothetical protein [Paludibacter sp.]